MSGEKAVVTCQKYQFSENKKIGLFQPKARLDIWPLAHAELKREHLVTSAGQPQDHRSVRHHRFEPAALYTAFQQRAAIDDPFGGACRDVEAPHRFIQSVLVKYKTRIVGPRHLSAHCRVRSQSTSVTTTRKHLWFYCWTLHSPGILRRSTNEISNTLPSLGFLVLVEYSCRKHTARRMCQLVDSKKCEF